MFVIYYDSARAKNWRERNDFYMLMDRSFNWKDKRNVTRWVFIDKRRRDIREITFDHRLYSLQEFKDIFQKLGLSIEEVYGSCLKEPFERNKSHKLLIIAKKEH